MADEKLIEAVAQAIREERQADPFDDRWDAYAAGLLSEAEARELEASLADGDERVRVPAAFRPLSEKTRADLVTRALRILSDERQQVSAAGQSIAPDVVPRRPNRRQATLLNVLMEIGRALSSHRPAFVWGAAGAGLIVLLWLGLPVVLDRSQPALPEYTLEVWGGDRELRSAETAASRAEVLPLRANSILELTLRPASRGQGSIAVIAFVVRDGRAQRWSAPIVRSEAGAFHVGGEVSRLFDRPRGDYLIVFAIGRPDKLPASPSAIERELAGSIQEAAGADYQILQQEVRVADGP